MSNRFRVKGKKGRSLGSVSIREMTEADRDKFLRLMEEDPVGFLEANPQLAVCQACGTYHPPDEELCPGCGQPWQPMRF